MERAISRSGYSGVTVFGLSLAICVVMLIALLPAEVEAAAYKHHISAWLDNTCIGGDAPKGSRLWVSWKGKAGATKKKGTVKTSAKGRWKLCADNKRVMPGDVIIAKLGKRKLKGTVPRLDVAVDRETSVVSGQTRAKQALIIQVCWWREQFKSTHCEVRSAEADAAGRFSVDMDTVISWGELLGGDKVEVFTYGGTNTFGRMQLVPYVEVMLGDDRLSGAYEPGKSLSVDLRDSGLTNKAAWTGMANVRKQVWSKVFEGRVQISGLYAGDFSPAGPVVEVGDRVTSPVLPPSYGLPVNDISVTANAAADVVSGTCATRSRYRLRVWTSGSGTKTFPTDITGNDGTFTRDLTGKYNVRKGTVVRLICDYRTGDRVSTAYAEP